MPDLVGRKFTADKPNRVYVGDITYLPCKGGKNMYLATVILNLYRASDLMNALADGDYDKAIYEATVSTPNGSPTAASAFPFESIR